MSSSVPATGLYVDKLSVLYLFQWQQMSIHASLGWLCILANLANSVASAMFLMWIVSVPGQSVVWNLDLFSTECENAHN